MQLLDTQSPACNSIIFYIIIIILLVSTENFNDNSLLNKQTKAILIAICLYIFFSIIQKLT